MNKLTKTEMKKTELAYQVWLFMKNNSLDISQIAEQCRVSKSRMKVIIDKLTMTRHEMNAICKRLNINKNELSIPPINSPSLDELREALPLLDHVNNISYVRERCNQIFAPLVQKYPIHELIRNCRWMLFLKINPDYVTDCPYSHNLLSPRRKMVNAGLALNFTKLISPKEAERAKKIIEESKKRK